MRPVAEWDESDLHELIRNEVQESLTLDYKGSAALAKTDDKKNAIAIAVSAFANSDGGLLVYGMQENKHVPTTIDVGVDRNLLTKEWLESVIKGRIRPALDKILIKQIQVGNPGTNMVVYVIEIGQATTRAPHQAADHKYYKRSNFESTPMEDYEIRDLMRRSIEYGKRYGAAWNLFVELRRLDTAMRERVQLNGSAHMPRDKLTMAVADGLRNSGEAIMSLDKEMRMDVANLITEVDGINAIIETTDPGQRDVARMTENLKTQLLGMIKIAQTTYKSLSAFLAEAT